MCHINNDNKKSETAASGSSGPRKATSEREKAENDLCDNKFQL